VVEEGRTWAEGDKAQDLERHEVVQGGFEQLDGRLRRIGVQGLYDIRTGGCVNIDREGSAPS
jgi:hypothetical protein